MFDPEPTEMSFLLGHDRTEEPVTLDLTGGHTLVTGAPGAGKTWLCRRVLAALGADAAVKIWYFEPFTDLRRAARHGLGGPDRSEVLAEGLTLAVARLHLAAAAARCDVPWLSADVAPTGPLLIIIDGLGDYLAEATFTQRRQQLLADLETITKTGRALGTTLLITTAPGVSEATALEAYFTHRITLGDGRGGDYSARYTGTSSPHGWPIVLDTGGPGRRAA